MRLFHGSNLKGLHFNGLFVQNAQLNTFMPYED